MDSGCGPYSEPLDALMKGSLEFTKDTVVMFCRGDESRAKLPYVIIRWHKTTTSLWCWSKS
jgi:hypothetical protein